MKIHAYAVFKKGGNVEPFVYEARVGNDDVVVRITHCSLANGDVQMIDNAWGDTAYPVVAGHEIIGVVEKTGAKVTSVQNGDRVGIGYQQYACFGCKFCLEGNEQFCSRQKVIGVHTYGGFADHIVADSKFVFKLPLKLKSASSCPLLSSGLTVFSAITRADLSERCSVAVLGVGGLGQLAVQFLKKMGHKVSAFSHSPTKDQLITRLGAAYINASNQNPAEHHHHRKFDLILSTLNVHFNMDMYLEMLKPQGKFCVVAQPSAKMPLSLGLLYNYAQRTIYGNYTGSRKDLMKTIAFAANYDIESVVETIAFSEINEALERVRNGVQIRMVLEHK